MRKFKNLKIATKLIVAFVFVSLIAGVVGIFGITNLKTIDRLYTSMNVDTTVELPQLSNVARAYLRQQTILRDLYLEKDSNKWKSYNDDFTAQLKIEDESLSTFENGIEDPNIKDLFGSLKSSLDDFDQLSKDFMNKFEAGQADEAYTLLTDKNGVDLTRKVQDTIDQLIQLQTDDVQQRNKANTASANNAVITMISVIIAGMLIAIILGIFISGIISRPVIQMAEAADKLALGDMNVHIEVHTKDEIGELAASFEKMVSNMNEVLTNVSTAAEQVASGSKQVSDSSMALSQGATEQASSIEELTASLEEISSQTKLNADNANQANDLAVNAKVNAVQGDEQMKQMLRAMEEINESSTNISRIIKVIDDIAFQTNILALNAAVEAARAGQHGKGFAVVAEEVRNLAARSASAAKETTDMIEGSIKKTEGGTKIARETAEALNKIVNGIEKVAALVNDIAVASNEQAMGIGQINQGIMQVSQVVQNNSATSEEGAAASEELSSQAIILKDMVNRFKLRQSFYENSKLKHLNPEVLAMLEKMSSNAVDQKADVKENKTEKKQAKPKIVLNDNEFGKY